ncbi:tyrosine-type recombinase/integrase [Lysinibacillus capsici]|uniref:tyrosine-type recombinase/integrase n=1 Tax=Lysinibacillus capsici TaxID=2115968 RepID=UPI0029DE6839|nr:tyrosine-type recombinase/integrase [Lysinibacillus capsici]WPK04273.1 tyrosine-type recombinase/integrase [Lysinibacillus capsici]
MSKKRNGLNVGIDLNGIFSVEDSENPIVVNPKSALSIEKALEIIVRQMRASGLRERTIHDYETYVNDFVRKTDVEYLLAIDSDAIYEWLGQMKVKDTTKRVRLKCFCAFLGKCFNNGWLNDMFWRNINIRVNEPIKLGATEDDVFNVLRQLDLSNFIELRDAAAILTMYQTGIRLATLSALEEHHVDLENRLLRIDGALLKNRKVILLPFDKRLQKIFEVLFNQNSIIREEKGIENNFVFLTHQGKGIVNDESPKSNAIAKRLNYYKRKYGIENINPHALRRGFAKDIYKRSNGDLALVSKALGHSDFAVTARYLHLDPEEVADKLREFR